MTVNNLMMSRRSVLGLAAAATVTAGLAACGSGNSDSGSNNNSSNSADAEQDNTVQLDTDAYDKLLAGGPSADASAVEASTWAKKVKDAGKLRVGGVQTSMLFSLLNEKDGKLRGFDAGLASLLARYITGSEDNVENTQVTSDTRESVLQNDQVDVVFATYSITDKRKEVISFAGPYYSTQQAILVMADNKDINSVDDLKGKNVAVQSGSTGPSVMEDLQPDAKLSEFKTDEEARSALEQGRVDAYVIDYNMQLGSMVRNPGKYRIAGDQFGPVDPYGIGLPLDSDGVDFVNAFLKEVEDSGLWEDLWKVCIGDRAGIDQVPEPPAIGA